MYIKNIFRFRWSCIIIHMLLLMIATLCIVILDICLFKPNAIILINNYSEITVAIWQVQASLGSVVISMIALIVGYYEKTYLGFSIKKALLVNEYPILLNFWESIVFVLSINFISIFLVIFNSMLAIIFIAICSLFYIIFIVYSCIYIILYIDKWKSKIETLAKTIISRYTDSKPPNKMEVLDFLGSLEKEIILKVEHKQNLKSDNELDFLIDQVVNKLDKTDLSDFSCEKVSNIFRKCLAIGYDDNIFTLYGCMRRLRNNTYSIKSESMIANAYYKGTIDKKMFAEAIRVIFDTFLLNYDASIDNILEFLRWIIYHHDKAIFKKTIQLIIERPGSDDIDSDNYLLCYSKQYILHYVIFYIKYLSFDEPLYKEMYDRNSSEDPVNLLNIIIDEEDEKTLKTYFFVENNFYHKKAIKLFIEDLTEHPGRWELMEHGSVKNLNFDDNRTLYSILYLYIFFTEADYNDNFLQEINFKDIYQFTSLFNACGSLKNRCPLVTFCEILNIQIPSENQFLFNKLKEIEELNSKQNNKK